MAISVEYVLAVETKNPMCKDAASFRALLQLHQQIEVDENTISFDSKSKCDFNVYSGTVESERYFHVRLSIEGDSEEQIKEFRSLLKAVRTSINVLSNKLVVVRDDTWLHYAQESYKRIHRTENLMRSVIESFMLFNLGSEWTKEAIPKDIIQARERNKEAEREPKQTASFLQRIDFADLATFLLRPYSAASTDDIFGQLAKAETLEEVEAIKKKLPSSNWKKYFSKLINCQDDKLKKLWSHLYELRCKVAHNTVFDYEDHCTVTQITDEIDPLLEEAIRKISEVNVPQSERQLVKDDAAGNLTWATTPENRDQLKTILTKLTREFGQLTSTAEIKEAIEIVLKRSNAKVEPD